MKYLSLVAALLASVVCFACNNMDDTDRVTNADCDDLVYEIYDECSMTLPMYQGAYPTAEDADNYCRDEKAFDWPCVDDCVFHNKKLCMSLKLCLENCR
jgi:hypothetical protein